MSHLIADAVSHGCSLVDPDAQGWQPHAISDVVAFVHSIDVPDFHQLLLSAAQTTEVEAVVGSHFPTDGCPDVPTHGSSHAETDRPSHLRSQ